MLEERKLEELKLKETINKFNEVIEDLDLTLTSISNKYKMDADQQYQLSKMYKNKLNITKKAIDKPYFARIDFKDENGNIEECYLSKVGISDFDNNLITVDWRVPIASLYYDSNLGCTSYMCPDGEITGELLKKRQYEIEDTKLISFNDVDTVSNDEILKPYLDVNADNRLKNIVSSIQGEQNKVIRKDISDNIIVQGVAGSGKTTVALHRIAYLAYNNRNIIDNDRYMVIGPNKFFINYISQVLPDLDVDDVKQLTFKELVEYYLDERINCKDIGIINNKININKYKVSEDYKNLIDKYINKIDVIGDEDFIINGYLILKNKEIKDIYNSLDDKLFVSIESKINKSILLISKLIKDNKDRILKRILNNYTDKVNCCSDISLLKKEYDYVRDEINKDCLNNLKKYFKFKNRKVLSIYYEFLNEYNSCFNVNVKGLIEEDLAGILYMGYLVKEKNEFKKYKHAVIDEAQDYGWLHFYSINKILEGCSFSVFGDLAQSIYDYKSINDWNEIKNCFEYVDLEYLKKSYRTTIEIMNSANKVLRYIGLNEAEPVIRHGDDVKVIKSSCMFETLSNCIDELIEKDYSSICIIVKDDKEGLKLLNKLNKYNINLITKDNMTYDGGLCICSKELVKGLEFDAVIISDVSEGTFNSNSSCDMKKLYVSMTRPLHELIMLYDGELTKALV